MKITVNKKTMIWAMVPAAALVLNGCSNNDDEDENSHEESVICAASDSDDNGEETGNEDSNTIAALDSDPNRNDCPYPDDYAEADNVWFSFLKHSEQNSDDSEYLLNEESCGSEGVKCLANGVVVIGSARGWKAAFGADPSFEVNWDTSDAVVIRDWSAGGGSWWQMEPRVLKDPSDGLHLYMYLWYRGEPEDGMDTAIGWDLNVILQVFTKKRPLDVELLSDQIPCTDNSLGSLIISLY